MNGSNSRSISVGSIPAPASDTCRTAWPEVGSAETETVTAPPGTLNLMAFESRFVTTCEIRAPSALTMIGAFGTFSSSRTPPSSR